MIKIEQKSGLICFIKTADCLFVNVTTAPSPWVESELLVDLENRKVAFACSAKDMEKKLAQSNQLERYFERSESRVLASDLC
jgi:hypothetical protein